MLVPFADEHDLIQVIVMESSLAACGRIGYLRMHIILFPWF